MRLRQNDLDFRLALGLEGDPAEAAILYFVGHAQADEGVPVEGKSGVWIVDNYMDCAERNVHVTQPRLRARRGASPKLLSFFAAA